MINLIKNVFKQKNFINQTKLQTFTYFIPSPPQRSSGYQEKQFDKIVNELIKQGHEIIELKTCPSSGSNSSGMWIIILLRSNTDNLEINIDDINFEKSTPEIEGLYYIDDQKGN